MFFQKQSKFCFFLIFAHQEVLWLIKPSYELFETYRTIYDSQSTLNRIIVKFEGVRFVGLTTHKDESIDAVSEFTVCQRLVVECYH